MIERVTRDLLGAKEILYLRDMLRQALAHCPVGDVHASQGQDYLGWYCRTPEPLGITLWIGMYFAYPDRLWIEYCEDFTSEDLGRIVQVAGIRAEVGSPPTGTRSKVYFSLETLGYFEVGVEDQCSMLRETLDKLISSGMSIRRGQH